MLAQLGAAGPVDGVLLDLHGAMVVEGIDDGDGDLLEAVRGAVGPDCPVVATFDLHGNHTRAPGGGGHGRSRLRHLPARGHGRARPGGGRP